jgi:hypothetical protein
MAAASPAHTAGLGSPAPFLTDTDYESMPIHWNDCEDYEIIRKVCSLRPGPQVLSLFFEKCLVILSLGCTAHLCCCTF